MHESHFLLQEFSWTPCGRISWFFLHGNEAAVTDEVSTNFQKYPSPSSIIILVVASNFSAYDRNNNNDVPNWRLKKPMKQLLFIFLTSFFPFKFSALDAFCWSLRNSTMFFLYWRASCRHINYPSHFWLHCMSCGY